MTNPLASGSFECTDPDVIAISIAMLSTATLPFAAGRGPAGFGKLHLHVFV